MITDLPKGASGPVWSPDGTRIAFESTTTQEDLQKAQQKKNAKPGDGQAESEHESDVHVINRAVYRSNDAGYLDPKRQAHIWVLEVPKASDEVPKPVQLTNGNFEESEPLWSHDGSRIYFTTRRVAEPYTNPQARISIRCLRRVGTAKNSPPFRWVSAISLLARTVADWPSTGRSLNRFAPILKWISG